MDWGSLEDTFESFPEEDKRRMSAFLNKLQSRDAVMMYNSLVQHCFTDCVDSFWRKSLGKKEEICVRHCVDKFLKLSALTGIKFSDFTP